MYLKFINDHLRILNIIFSAQVFENTGRKA